jgi:integrase
MSYENRHVLRDGRIVLYTRNGRPTYHARLNLDGVDGYITKSTKRSSLAEAVRAAEDMYDDLRYKVRHGLEVRPHTFASLWKRWDKANVHLLSKHRYRYISGTARRYLLPYFGSMSLEQINDVTVERYWNWRLNYWTSPEGLERISNAQKTRCTGKRPYKQKLGNVAKTPSQKSLEMEQSALRQIFKWGRRNGLISNIPEVRAPKLNKGQGVSRRPAFDLDEWRKLYRYLRRWSNNDLESASNSKHRPNSYHLWQRELIRRYVLFMAASGLRPNEARQLRWRDIEPFTDEDGVEHQMLHVSPTTKTGHRQCVPLRITKMYLDALREHSLHTKPDDLVFCDRKGKPVQNFGKTFKKVLIDADLLTDRWGNVRTIYSLRHTYATFRLLYGNANIEDLAQNMGTSPQQIFNHYRHITIRQKAPELGGRLHSKADRKGLYL